MYCYIKISKRYLLLFWITLIALSFLTFEAQSIEPAFDVTLSDGSKIWLHGKSKGSIVTFAGMVAKAGLYSSSDGKIAFTVGEDGRLTAPVTFASNTTQQSDDKDFEDDDEEDFE